MAAWQPMASMVTVQPTRSSSLSSAGIAVISLDLPSTASWPSTSPDSAAQARTRCSAARPVTSSREPRAVLPSRARSRGAPGRSGATAVAQARKQRPNAAGSSRAKTRPKVSWLGMPRGRARKVRSQGSLARPNAATATQLSAPHSTAHSAMVRISSSRWALVRATRGSGSAAKCRVMLVSAGSAMPPPLPRCPCHPASIARRPAPGQRDRHVSGIRCNRPGWESRGGRNRRASR